MSCTLYHHTTIGNWHHIRSLCINIFVGNIHKYVRLYAQGNFWTSFEQWNIYMNVCSNCYPNQCQTYICWFISFFLCCVFTCFSVTHNICSHFQKLLILFFSNQAKQMQRHLCVLQMSQYLGLHSNLSMEETQTLAKELMQRHQHGLTFGKQLLKTDLQYSDDYLLLTVHLLLDLWQNSGRLIA